MAAAMSRVLDGSAAAATTGRSGTLTGVKIEPIDFATTPPEMGVDDEDDDSGKDDEDDDDDDEDDDDNDDDDDDEEDDEHDDEAVMSMEMDFRPLPTTVTSIYSSLSSLT